MGDAAGVGPEVVVKALASGALASSPAPLLVGAERVFRPLLERITPRPAFRLIEPAGLPDRLPAPGRVDPDWGRAAMLCLEEAVRLIRSGEGSALVTAPLNKEGIHRAGYPFQGHTDFLAHLAGSPRHAMMLAGGTIRVILATVHIALRDVAAALNVEGIADKIRLAHEYLPAFGCPAPRIAVAGLNPHAGEGGAFGREEIEVIAPAVEICREEGIAVSGPLPPDTLFHRLHRGEFDAAVTMYHDQGLIPLKMIAFEEGVNITLGLPFIRTSPDHGTAYDIAGKGTADPRSMIAAIKLAEQLAAYRMDRGPDSPALLPGLSGQARMPLPQETKSDQ